MGLAACRRPIAFGRGDHAAAIARLGSHAHRELLQLTLLRSVERFRGRSRIVRAAAWRAESRAWFLAFGPE